MLIDIVEVESLTDYKLRLRFGDGTEGTVDIAALTDFRRVFSSLRDKARFREVRVDPELGTICWPNGADVDPDVLYSVVSGEPIGPFDSIRAGSKHSRRGDAGADPAD